ncbi:MAG: LysR family transcriptional regulator [Rhodospirillales bacterium]|jgi:LysR family transcriptional regulator of gallate degradation|nr:LysR family transcriptional regulator [Rhodospirillales bacterium]
MLSPADKNFSFSHLAAFVTVLEHGRISRASAQLRRSPSAVSRSIGILEEKLGRPLLERSHGGVSPTAEGMIVAERCRLIQWELLRLRDHLVQVKGGQVRPNASAFQMHIDVSRLRALITVHDFGSVQRASQLLAVSQPAVSASIRHLEADLGVELFSRSPTGMIATPAGVSSTFCFKRVLSELRKMKDDVDSLGGASSGLVCVGGLAYARSALLPDTIRQVLSSYPQITVRTVEGPIAALLAAMHAGDIDALICAHPNPALLEGVTVEPIARDRMGLFVAESHPLAGRRALSAREVIDFPFILPPLGTVTRDLLDVLFIDAVGRPPQGSVETSSYSIITDLLLKSEQICFRSTTEFAAVARSGQILALDLDFALPERSICLLQRRGAKQTAAARDVLDIVRHTAASQSVGR